MTKAYLAAQARLTTMKKRLAGLRADEAGAALVEYALVVGMMAVIAVAAITSLSPQVKGAFTAIGKQLSTNVK